MAFLSVIYLLLSFNLFVPAPQVSLKCTDTDCACHLAPPDAPCCCLSDSEQQRADQSRPDALPLAQLFGNAKCQGSQSSALGVLLTHSLHVTPLFEALSFQLLEGELCAHERFSGWVLPDPLPGKVPIYPS